MQEMQKKQFRFLSWEDPLEKGMATHSNICAWRILWTREPAGAIDHAFTGSDITEVTYHTAHTSYM